MCAVALQFSRLLAFLSSDVLRSDFLIIWQNVAHCKC